MNICKFMDHTILKPEASIEAVKKVVDEALEYNFFSVCVNSCHAKFVSDSLKGSDVKTCVVVGFPLGACTTATKVFETEDAIKNGAEEIDMVINVGALKDKNYEFVINDIKKVKEACGKNILKVILETCLLSEEEIIEACKCSMQAGADFVKTSTGFSTSGAKVEHVKLMRKIVGDSMGVKASGGIRTFEDAKLMIEAGASRLGVSAGVEIAKQSK